MAKEKSAKKDTKTAATKTLKEKRQEKKRLRRVVAKDDLNFEMESDPEAK